MSLDGAHTDEELCGDPAVSLACGYESENFKLAFAQGFGKISARRRGARVRPAPPPLGAS